MSTMKLLHVFGWMFRESGQAMDRLGCVLQGSLAHKNVLNRHQTIMKLYDQAPHLPTKGFIAPSASVIGDVHVGEKSSIWYGCVVRGDVNHIKIGNETNIQDNTVIHVAKHNVDNKPMPTVIGDRVTIGHSATLHACRIGDEAFIGMGAIVMDGANVQDGSMVAAGSLVAPGTTIPTGELWAGVPAKFKRQMTAAESAFAGKSAANYCELAARHSEENGKSYQQVVDDKEKFADSEELNPDYLDHMGLTREQYLEACKSQPEFTKQFTR